MENLLLYLLILIVTLAGTRNYVIYPSYPLIEKLITSEYSLLATTEFILRDEKGAHSDGQDVHELEDVERFIEEMKLIHEEIGRHVRNYAKHPINVFFVIKRMAIDWVYIIRKLKETKLCETSEKLKKQLDLIDGDLLPQEALTDIALDLVSLRNTYNISVTDLVEGTFTEHASLHQLTVEDTFLLARSAYDAGIFAEAAIWAKYTKDRCVSKKESCMELYGINLSSPYNLLAQSYFRLKRIQEAVAILNELLVIDPSNIKAKRNKKYFMESSSHQSTQKVEKNSILLSNKTQELCRGYRTKSSRHQANLTCYLFPTKNMFMYEKVEVLNRKPAVYLFHGVFNWRIVTKMRGIGYDWILNAWQYYGASRLLNMYDITDSDNRIWEQVVNKRLGELKGLLHEPYKRSAYKVTVHGPRSAVDPKLPTKQKGENVGSFQIFLSDNRDFTGGTTVFPKNNVRVDPERGAVLFWYESKSAATICPVLHGCMWVARHSIEELPIAGACRPR